MSHFRTTADGIEIHLSAEERMFLGDVLPLLAEVGVSEGDPAAARLRVPVYLDDPESSEEWWRLMGQDLKAGRQADRAVFHRAVTSETPLILSQDEADSVLRVLNETRLALGARLGIDVESDHDELSSESRQVMDYLGWIQEELTVELLRSL